MRFTELIGTQEDYIEHVGITARRIGMRKGSQLAISNTISKPK